MDEENSIITLTDEDGSEVDFLFLDLVECDGQEYVVLIPTDDEESGEVVILRIEGEGDDESYASLDDEEEADRVFAIFKERQKDNFNFV